MKIKGFCPVGRLSGLYHKAGGRENREFAEDGKHNRRIKSHNYAREESAGKVVFRMAENGNGVKMDARYWERQRRKYELMIKSAERQLEETDVLTPEWEERYSLLLDLQEKATGAETRRIKAALQEPSGF